MVCPTAGSQDQDFVRYNPWAHPYRCSHLFSAVFISIFARPASESSASSHSADAGEPKWSKTRFSLRIDPYRQYSQTSWIPYMYYLLSKNAGPYMDF